MISILFKSLLFCILLFLFLPQTYGSPIYSRTQLKKLENKLIKQEGNSRINTLLELSEAYINFQLDTAFAYSELARYESVQTNYQWGYYKSIYCSALSKVDNTPFSQTIPYVKISSNWFEIHSYEKDAIYSELLYAYSLFFYKSSNLAYSISKENLLKAKKIGDNRLIGLSYLGINNYAPPLIRNKEYENAIDSALYFFERTNDSLEIGLISLSKYLSINGTKKAFNNSFLQLENAEKWGNNSLSFKSNRYLAFGFASISNLDSSLYYLQISTSIAKELNNRVKEQKALKIKSYAYQKSGQYKDAISIQKSIKTIAIELENYLDLSKANKTLGEFYMIIGEYQTAIPLILESLEIAKKRQDEYVIFYNKYMLGNSYRYTKQYEKAEKTYTELLKWAEENLEGKVQEETVGKLFKEFAELKIEQGDFTEGINYYQQAIGYSDNQFAAYYITTKSRLAIAYLNNSQFQKADSIYQRINLEHGEHLKSTTPAYKLLAGRINIVNHNYSKGIFHLNDYLEKNEGNRISKSNKIIYYDLYTAHTGLKNYKEALDAFKIYKTINDSLELGITVDNVAKTQAEYELSMSEATVSNLREKQELQGLRLEAQNNLLINRKMYIIILSLFALLVFAISYLLFRRYRQKKENEKTQMKAKRAELELENVQSQQKAEISEVKNMLFANISHEFRTPLTLIKVPIQNYKSKIPKEDIPIFDRVIENTDELLNMIDELLDLARMESGSTEIHRAEFDLLHFSLQSKAVFSTLFREKQITVNWIHPEKNAHFNGDENRLKIVLNNLLKNAYHHTPENGIVNVSFSIFNPMLKEDILITVSNSGKQIDKEDLINIFDRYYRGDEKSYVGNGIGLSISKQIIDLHKGKITAHNQADGFVSFKVFLPGKIIIPISSNKLIANNNEIKKPDLPTSNQAKAHILVVEDNEQMRYLLATVLSDNFKLTFANDGEAGEKTALKIQPDLILSDIMMPKKDGYELLKAIKTNIAISHIPVILLTAKSDIKSEIIGLNNNADAYITKPFDPVAIIARIENLLRQRKALQKLFFQNPFVLSKELKCTPLDAEFIDRARNILDENFENGDFTVSDFCSALALNRNSVHNKLKAFTKQNTSQFIRNFRIEKAVKLLIETNQSMTDIYSNCGFNSPQTFSKAFKERFNLTATEYREQNRA